MVRVFMGMKTVAAYSLFTGLKKPWELCTIDFCMRQNLQAS